MSFSPFARYRNFTLKNLKDILMVYPDMAQAMSWNTATGLVNSINPSYQKTAYQQACQLGLEDRSGKEFAIQSYVFTLDDAYLEKYLEFWIKTYYAPNPYVNSKDPSMLLFCEIADAILASPNHEIDYDAFFLSRIAGGSDDILMNAIVAYGHPIQHRKIGTVNHLYVDPTDVTQLADISSFVRKNYPIPAISNQKTFFDRYSYENFISFHGFKGQKLSFSSGYATPCDFKRNRIVFGAPGTGKSHRINEDKEKLLGANSTNYERVTFYGDYSYSQFVGTYKPVTDEKGNIEYTFVPGPFMRILAEAYSSIYQASDVATGIIDPARVQPFVLIIEEINRAKAATVFGDVFQLLDRDQKTGTSQYDIHLSDEMRTYLAKRVGNSPECFRNIKIPDNLFIWASMNSADQGVFPIDTAFKRRWSFEYIGIDDEEFGMELRPGNTHELRVKAVNSSGIWVPTEPNVPGEFMINGNGPYKWNVLRRAINAKLSSDEIRVHEDKLLGPFFLNTKDEPIDPTTSLFIDNEAFLREFESKVLMYLFEDAAKTRRDRFFSCNENRYSSLCTAFRDKGLAIFGTDFEKTYYSTQEAEMQQKIDVR